MTNEISINIEKGIKLLNEALKQYENGEYSSAYKTYQKAGSFLTEADTRANTDEGRISLKYGGNRNFGVIYKIFESNTRDLLRNKSSQRKLKKIMSLIRENKVLNDEFNAYNAFTNPINVENPSEYVAEAVSLITRYSGKTIRENNEKLINLFKEYNLNENISVDDSEIELFENIEYMILHNKDFKNINKYNDIQKKLCEYVEENNNVLTESKNIDDLYEGHLNEFVDRYEKELTEDEVKLIMEVKDPAKAKKLFNKYKTEVTSLVNEQIKEGKDVESWNEILNKIDSKVYEHKTALTDIAEFIEIKNEIEG
jgi:hypothetical protein